MKKISEHISYLEAIRTYTGFANDPPANIINVMRITAFNVFEPMRHYFDVPIYISSFYRSEAVNKAVGGAKTSQHLLGEAIDMDARVFENLTNKEVFEFIRANSTFDQLIWEAGNDKEPDWIHVSFREGRNRMQVLRMQNGKYWKI